MDKRSDKYLLRAKHKIQNVAAGYSTTALMCEPIFTSSSSQAQWYHDGIVVANVSSTSNAVLHDRKYYNEQTIPDVGFLIITNISLEDEGDYWCRRTDDKQEGEVARIVVAYVEQFPDNSQPTFHPAVVHFGERVTVHCPRTNAVPVPSYTWLLNGEALDLSTKRIVQSSNGSLQIRQFMRQDIGIYECVVTNFAGRTSAKTYVDAIPLPDDVFDDAIFTKACESVFRSGLMWFLIGCLVTSGTLLSYLVFAILLARSTYRNRASLYLSPFLQFHPNLAPGFRKVVAPIANVHRSLQTSLSEQQGV
uniref:Ig-like domain-containing protein n=1 Tax=Setaria digitata TaxID=48799 RepID=A0A915Q0R9_9BILA